MMDNETIKARDILDKLDFFEGQRAGRELWFSKPEEIQSEDIEDFSKDIAFLRGFIEDQKAEIEALKDDVEFLDNNNDELIREIEKLQRKNSELEKANESFSCMGMPYSEIKAEARKEFAERVKVEIALNTRVSNDAYLDIDSDIDSLLEKMESERK